MSYSKLAVTLSGIRINYSVGYRRPNTSKFKYEPINEHKQLDLKRYFDSAKRVHATEAPTADLFSCLSPFPGAQNQ